MNSLGGDIYLNSVSILFIFHFYTVVQIEFAKEFLHSFNELFFQHLQRDEKYILEIRKYKTD